MDETKLNDAVVNALGVLKRIRRLSGVIVVSHRKLVHADLEVKAFSSERFAGAVQTLFDNYAEAKKPAERIALLYGEMNVLLFAGGPMIFGFFFNDRNDLESVETGIGQFLENFGPALGMNAPTPPPRQKSEVEVAAEEEAAKSGGLRKIDVGTPVVIPTRSVPQTHSSEKPETKPEPTPEPDDDPRQDIMIAKTVAPPRNSARAIFLKIFPEQELKILMARESNDEILQRVPDKRVRCMLANELETL
ncbi:MAG: hypothetical protein HKN23_21430 [Verrucomicrobiales bacterium]|nr:hypothetical protein [Verrucomicrobiales bacterium]